MGFEFILIRVVSVERDCSGHFQEGVAKELEPLIVTCRPSLKVVLIYVVLIRVIPTSGEGLEGKVWSDGELEKFADILSYETGLNLMYYRGKTKRHGYYVRA